MRYYFLNQLLKLQMFITDFEVD